jgi:CHAD domain-containing protein
MGNEASIGVAALGIIKAESAKLPALKAAVLTSEEPENVHNLRVGIRRIRTGIRVLGTFLPPSITALDVQLHDLFEELGHVRDHDIAVAAWAAEEMPDTVRAEVLEQLKAARSSARLRLTVTLAKESCLDELVKTVRKKPAASLAAETASLASAPIVLKEAFQSAKSAVRRLNSDSPLEDIHRFRRRIKRLRYAVEFFANDYGKPAAAMAKDMKELQDLLGEHQDCLLVARILRELPELSPDAQRYVGDELSDLDQKANRLRRKLQKAAGEFGGKPWDRLKKRMRREAESC